MSFFHSVFHARVRPKARKNFPELKQQHDYIALEGAGTFNHILTCQFSSFCIEIMESWNNFESVGFVESSDDEEKIAQSIEEYLTKKAEEYNKKTRDDKNNVKLWIEFINFQDEYMKLGGEAIGPILEKKSMFRTIFTNYFVTRQRVCFCYLFLCLRAIIFSFNLSKCY